MIFGRGLMRGLNLGMLTAAALAGYVANTVINGALAGSAGTAEDDLRRCQTEMTEYFAVQSCDPADAVARAAIAACAEYEEAALALAAKRYNISRRSWPELLSIIAELETPLLALSCAVAERP